MKCSASLMALTGVLFHLFVTSAALNVNHRSSHSSSATAFRASNLRQKTANRGQRHRQVPGAVPLYVPKIGLANVTAPTAFPPLPPPLDPWADHQPFDTALGHYIVSGFLNQPTATPPPTQAALDLAFACPMLLNWPIDVAVQAPDACGSMRSGNWSNAADQGVLINWETDCVDIKGRGGMPSAAELTTYYVPTGDVFGSSMFRKSPFGNYIELIDCGGVTVFTVEEKVYKQTGVDEDSCEKYKSCDGIIWLQYFIKNGQGQTVALTGYLNIFQSTFDLIAPGGLKIATMKKNWDSSVEQKCNDGSPTRKWGITFEPTPPGIWGVATNQWPIAAMMTMMAQRDEHRQPDGSAMMSNCESMKLIAMVALGLLGLSCVVCVPLFTIMMCGASCRRGFTSLEEKLFAKRMNKPQMYGN